MRWGVRYELPCVSACGYAPGSMHYARFPGSGSSSADLSAGPSFFSVPQRRARFPGLVSFSFPGPLKSQWALQAFEDTVLGMRRVCAVQGNGVPRKAVPAKRSGKACLCKTGMHEGMRTIYIYILPCIYMYTHKKKYIHLSNHFQEM